MMAAGNYIEESEEKKNYTDYDFDDFKSPERKASCMACV